MVKYGYTLSSETNEWNKDIWTVRFMFSEMEAFNTPRTNTPGKYYKCDTDLENLEEILKEIDSFIK